LPSAPWIPTDDDNGFLGNCGEGHCRAGDFLRGLAALNLLVSGFDEQRSNLVVLECEVVMELNRASWEVTADSGGDYKLLAVACDASYVGSRLRVCCGPVNPHCDFGTVVIVGLVVDVGIGSEQREEISKRSCVGGVEEGCDNRRKFYVHLFLVDSTCRMDCCSFYVGRESNA
jgi:hypothetical protein